MKNEKIYTHNDMNHNLKYLYYPLFLFRNMVINKIPSRHFRKWIDILLGARFGKKSFLFRRTELLFPKGLLIGDYSTVGWFCLLDARGGIKIGNNVTIASYVKIITGTHNTHSSKFEASFNPITIDDYAWICTGVTICPNVHIGEGAVIAAGSVVTKNIEPYTVVAGVPAKKIGERCKNLDYCPSTPFKH